MSRDLTPQIPERPEPNPRAEVRAVFDHEDALARMDGDVGMLRELLQIFLQDSPNMLARIDAALTSADARQIERAAHGLKGASATISADALTDRAVQVEQAAKAGRVAEAKRAIPALRQELQRLVVVLDRVQRAA